MVELQFDTNVVPQADYFHDYEQLWKEQKNNAERRTRDDGSYEVKNYYSEDDKDSSTEGTANRSDDD